MAKFVYTDEMISEMENACASGVTEEVIEKLCNDFEFPRRSVTAKLRKLGYDVPTKPKTAPVFSEAETQELQDFLEAHSGEFTAEEIAEQIAGGKFNARQVNGKALSLELTSAIKPADKKVTPKTFTDEEQETVSSMAEDGAYIEDIAEAVGKSVQSVRGKLLSMGLKAPQRDRKTAVKTDAYDGIEDIASSMTVAELAEKYGKTERGVKTVLSRRQLSASDYTPKSLKSDD